LAHVPPKHAPVFSYIRAGQEALDRVNEVVDRVKRRRLEAELSQAEVARLMSIDPRTVKDFERQSRPRVVQITQKLVHRIEAGELSVSGVSGGRGLLVGPGVEMLLAMEQALDAAPGDFTRDLYWPSDGGSLEDRIKAEPGIDLATKDVMLRLLESARR
jgi:transcriptional regulator with XRE-family HTH domain